MSKKSFKNDISNPALSYLQPADPVEVQQAYERNQAEPERKRTSGESKTRRVQLLMQPSLHKAIEEQANHEGTSVNAWIHETLKKAIGERK